MCMYHITIFVNLKMYLFNRTIFPLESTRILRNGITRDLHVYILFSILVTNNLFNIHIQYIILYNKQIIIIYSI